MNYMTNLYSPPSPQSPLNSSSYPFWSLRTYSQHRACVKPSPSHSRFALHMSTSEKRLQHGSCHHEGLLGTSTLDIPHHHTAVKEVTGREVTGKEVTAVSLTMKVFLALARLTSHTTTRPSSSATAMYCSIFRANVTPTQEDL